MPGTAPTDDTSWATGSGSVLEPTSKRSAGWGPGDEPPAEWLNWWQRAVYRWLYYYGSKNVAGGVAGIDDTDGSIKFTATVSNKPAIEVTGNGTSFAIKGTGGSSNGTGVEGVGGGTDGVGVKGTSDDSSGVVGVCGSGDAGGSVGVGVRGEGDSSATAGVHGVCAGTYGGYFLSTSTSENSWGAYIQGNVGGGLVLATDISSPARAALRFVPQDAEPTGANGGNNVGDMYVTTAGVLKICTVAGTPGTWVSVGAQT